MVEIAVTHDERIEPANAVVMQIRQHCELAGIAVAARIAAAKAKNIAVDPSTMLRASQRKLRHM